MGRRLTLHFTPGSKRSKWIKYREAWELLRVLEIQACVDPLTSLTVTRSSFAATRSIVV